ncbi:MAG: carboxy terminal-processing peptidase, partial [Opitutaceae bacterium]
KYLPIGESNLPHALIWDRIAGARFDGAPLDPKVLDALRADSEARQSKLQEFAYLRREVSWFKAHQDEDRNLSLDLDERLKEQKADEAFRKVLDAERDRLVKSDYAYKEFRLGPPPEKSSAAASGDDSDEDLLGTDVDQPYKADIELRETLRILRDAISLGRNHQYWASNHAPLTVAAANP